MFIRDTNNNATNKVNNRNLPKLSSLFTRINKVPGLSNNTGDENEKQDPQSSSPDMLLHHFFDCCDTILEEDHPRSSTSKFGPIGPSGSRENQNVKN